MNQKLTPVQFSIQDARRKLQEIITIYQKYKDDKNFIGNEKQACQSLIIPLIRDILHWKTDDYAEFKTEESVSGKRIDYVVLNQGISQFIVEAKAPSKDIFDREDYYTQALGYGYSKEKDFAILTNFRQVVILGCQIQWRVPGDAVLAKFNLVEAGDEDLQVLLAFEKDYWMSIGKENWLYSKLSKHKKTIPLDERLLGDMKEWREQLLRNIKQNSRFNKFDFDDEDEFMRVEQDVQKFIDRLIFICFCEDKELHEPHLKSLMHDKNERYTFDAGWLLDKIRKLFEEYRRGYDSDLFDKSDCDTFKIDDVKIVEIIGQLREPKGRVAYDFKSIEADILGKTYENFIGHIQTGKKRFKEKEDLGKRKKEGIYYTPKYIVDYIVNNTVREYVKGKSFDEIKKVRILDPACGSGSFLRVAYDVLVEESQKVLKRQLTYEEKKELLLNCIYGVDLDERAREIAKFNLSLKLAERGQKLPMLGENIRLGNSLIDDKNVAGYKHFIWEEEFKEIMDDGGFDVVVGNPPWGADIPTVDKQYYSSKYSVDKLNMNTFELFLWKSIMLLNHKKILGFLVPRNFIRSGQYTKIRKKFITDFCILHLIDFKKFPEVTQECVCIIAYKDKNNTANKVLTNNSQKIEQSLFLQLPGNIFNLNLTSEKTRILKKINGGISLGELFDITRGEELNKNGGVVRCPSCKKWSFASKKEKKVCNSCNNEFDINKAEKRRIISDKYIPSYSPILIGEDFSRYRIIKKHFINLKMEGLKLKSSEIYQSPKLIMMAVSPLFIVALDENENIILTKNNYSISPRKDKSVDLKCILAVLNSELFRFYQQNSYTLGAEFTIFISQEYLNQVRILDFQKISIEMKANIIKFVSSMLSLNKQLTSLSDKKSDLRAKIEAEIKKTDQGIDELVYKLYGITEEERKIIEESLR